MAPRKPFPHGWKTAGAALVAFGLFVARSHAGDREQDDRGLFFVHFTDPHLFLKPKDEGKEERERQNKEALSDMLAAIPSLPGSGEPPAFLIFTGDLGIDPCEIATDRGSTKTCLETADKSKRAEQIRITAETLGRSPVRDVYLVAGNNDIANESAGDEALGYFNQFIDDVQAKLDSTRVQLHNLTRGYSSTQPAATCYADIPHTNYRLIGFPSYSFKPVAEGQEKKDGDQEKHVAIFRGLVEAARDRKVLVVSHTPGIEDPYALARARFPKTTPTPSSSPTPSPSPGSASSATPTVVPGVSGTPAAATTPAPEETPAKTFDTSTWKVSEKVLKTWNDAIASNAVLAVLAGHLHDSHKEIYEPPYLWSNSSEHRSALHKLFLAPPLAVKNQDTSPIQARGFALIRLKHDRVQSRLFWYDSQTRKFTPDSKPKPLCERLGFWRKCCDDLCAASKWLWNLDTGNSLERMATLLIAFLTAFLTIVAIWQIPPPDDPFPEVKKAGPGEANPPQPAANASSESTPFSSRFGKTVIAGLAGLIAAEVAKTLGNQQSTPNTRLFYIVWFILFFFLLLASLNLWRALVEALRSRFAIIYYPLPRPPEPVPIQPSGGKELLAGRFWRWLVYRFYASLHWLKSWLGVPLLTFADTFISLIQGKNQTTTKVFSDKIVDQQRNVLLVAKEIREQLNEVILKCLRTKNPAIEPKDVRVNVSVLSADRTHVFYISRNRDSSRLSFPKRSVAWLSVFTGKIRWHKRSYDKLVPPKINLFDNSAGTIPDEVAQIPLSSYYQARGGDYEAFVVFPVPLSQRGLQSEYVKGAIQVSFSRQSDFDSVWSVKWSAQEITNHATEEVDGKINAATTPQARQQLEQTRDADIQAAVTATMAKFPASDPVVITGQYQSEERMLTAPWCADIEVRATLNTCLRVLGEVLRGFNENIYKSIAKSEQPD